MATCWATGMAMPIGSVPVVRGMNSGGERRTCWAAGMVMPIGSVPVGRGMVVRGMTAGGERRPNTGGERSSSAKPEKKEGKEFVDQLAEWTLRSSLNETDPVLKKTEDAEEATADEKKGPETSSSS